MSKPEKTEESKTKEQKLKRLLDIPLKDWPDSPIEMVKFAFKVGWSDSRNYHTNKTDKK